MHRDLAASHLSMRGEDVCIWLPLFAEGEGFLKTQFGIAAQATASVLADPFLLVVFSSFLKGPQFLHIVN